MIQLGIRRSGNHAISKWIVECFKGDYAYLNNVELGRLTNDIKVHVQHLITLENYPIEEVTKYTDNGFIVLRSVKNCLASQWKEYRDFGKLYNSLSLYSGYINSDWMKIYYDRWLIDSDYRKEVADKLALDYTEPTKGVPHYGSSSFVNDDRLNRWKQIPEKSLFHQFLADNKNIIQTIQNKIDADCNV